MKVNGIYEVPPEGLAGESATRKSPSQPLDARETIFGDGVVDRVDEFSRDRLTRLRSTLSDRTSRVRSNAMERIHLLQSAWRDRTNAICGSVTTKIDGLKPVVRQHAMRLRDDVRGNPGRWAGIAVGAGLALGIGGRIVRQRMRRPMPSIVIIESMC